MSQPTSISPDVCSVWELLVQRVQATPAAEALSWQSGEGIGWRSSWAELKRDAEQVAAALLGSGVRPADLVLVCAPTSPHFWLIELACVRLGVRLAGVEPHASQEQTQATLLITQPALLVGTATSLRRCISETPTVLLDLELPPDRDPSWQAFLARGRGQALPPPPVPSMPATVVFSSGTTGAPKSLCYRQDQLVLASVQLAGLFGAEVGPSRQAIAWLPMAALYQRVLNLVAIQTGTPTHFVSDPLKIVDVFEVVAPTIITGVPRFFEKVYHSVWQNLRRRGPLAVALLRVALQLGSWVAQCRSQGRSPNFLLRRCHAFLDRRVLSRVRRLFGANVRWLVSGSAALPEWLLCFYEALGLPVLEAYGVSENIVPVTANSPREHRRGSVGKPLPANEVRLAADGEVQVRGAGVFSGYAHAETPAYFTNDGFYCTGDLGRFDADGFLYLTGRKAEMFKLSTGRQVSPTRLEALYRQSPVIEQVVVLGLGQAFPVALIKAQAEANSTAKVLQTRVQAELERLGGALPLHERVRHFALLERPLSIERGELTSSLKLRRAEIARRHARTIAEIYDHARDLPDHGQSTHNVAQGFV